MGFFDPDSIVSQKDVYSLIKHACSCNTKLLQNHNGKLLGDLDPEGSAENKQVS